MKRIVYILFGLLLAIDTFCQVAFKMTGERTAPPTFDAEWFGRIVNEPWALGILACYLASFVTYMTVIRNVHIGPAFAASHLEIVTVLAVSVWWFGERFTMMQVLGCLAILGGVVILALTEKDEQPETVSVSAPAPAPKADPA
jgi:drug/metabolite transporter (DMT)-like permease